MMDYVSQTVGPAEGIPSITVQSGDRDGRRITQITQWGPTTTGVFHCIEMDNKLLREFIQAVKYIDNQNALRELQSE